MMLSFVSAALLLVQLEKAPPVTPGGCTRTLPDATDAAASEVCLGDDADKAADAAPKGSAERTRRLTAATGHYRRAVTIASKPRTKQLALDLLADIYDAPRLDDPNQMENALRERIALTPEDLTPTFRLAKLQERQQRFDAVEETLLDAKRRQPDAVEPYRMLSQFFARRVTALHKRNLQTQAPTPDSNPGEPDANGVYRIGGALPPPSRDDVPHYPPDALAAGVKGSVMTEVIVDPTGAVTDAKVVQSIPLLDEEALRVVRNWHFAPTVVNGQPVPVRMRLLINFAPPTPPR